MKYTYKLIVLWVVLSVFWVSPASAQTVNFPDANLAAAVRDELGLGPTDPITQTDLEGLQTLFVYSIGGIRDLNGLQAANNLDHLDLGVNSISDLRPLSRLTNLLWLGLSNNQIRDISPLSRLTKLLWLGIGHNQISDLRPLSRLTNLLWLDITLNPITDISPLLNLPNLEQLYIDAAFDEKYPGVLRQTIPANTQIYFAYPENPGEPVLIEREKLSRPPKRKRVVQRCGLGWSPQSQYGHRFKPPKAMIYALEFEYKQDPRSRYICTVIEIRTGDPAITHLNGWKLYLGTLYNPSYVPIVINNAQVIDGILRLTPDMLGLDEFRCLPAYIYSQAVPSVFYELKTKNNITVDRAYSCFIWGQSATMQVNGIWEKSPRRFSLKALREMDTPRIERYITKTNSVYVTHTGIEDFRWDRAVLSDWLLPAHDTPQLAGGNAPSVYRKLTTSWAALKK